VPLELYVTTWLSLLLRWAHIVTGIAWIGASFYFIWLDARLNVPPRNPEHDTVAGDLWAVHGGGFYHAQKYQVAPPALPEPLHWFKWEAYFTWLTGFALFIVLYYVDARAFLIDERVAQLTPATAIASSVGLLLASVVVYQVLCRVITNTPIFTLVGSGVVLGACWLATHLYSGRGAFLQIGAMIGTIMVTNVAHVIIPSQKRLVAAKRDGTPLDPALGLEAKRRSVHNNYFTLPVLLAMISPHFAFLYAHTWSWAILFALFVAGALIRHWFNLRNRGHNLPAVPAAALAILVAVAVVIAPAVKAPVAGPSGAVPGVSFVQVHGIVQERCVPCHSSTPTNPVTNGVPAAGIAFDSPRDIATWASRIYERAVVTRTMPLGNATGMTDEERDVLALWFTRGAPVE